MAAIELELARAGRALDDLAAAPRGRRRRVARASSSTSARCVESYAPAWRTLAAGYGATLPRAGARRRRPHVARSASPPPAASAPTPASPRVPAPPALMRVRVARASASPPSAAARPGSAVVAPPRRAARVTRAPPRRTDARRSSPPTRCGSPRRCANLIGNAAEHGDGEVRVRVRAAWRCRPDRGRRRRPGPPGERHGLTAHARGAAAGAGTGWRSRRRSPRDHGGRLFAAPSESGARLVFELPAAARPPVAMTARGDPAQVSGHTPAKARA